MCPPSRRDGGCYRHGVVTLLVETVDDRRLVQILPWLHFPGASVAQLRDVAPVDRRRIGVHAIKPSS